MGDDEMIFDPLMKKKKKKKPPMPFDINAALQEVSEGVPAAATNNSALQENEEKDDQDNNNKENKEKDDDLGLDDDFSNLKKKKKKAKKKPFNLEDLDSALPESSLGDGDNVEGGIDDQLKNEGMADDDLDFNLPSKKKKKKKTLKIDELASEATLDKDDDDLADEIGDNDGKVIESGGVTWHGSDRDYTFDELLFRAFDIMREKNPDMVAGEKRRFVMRPPQVVRVGTKKTSFANFTEICKMLHRQPKHLLAFLLTELGTSGSVDGNNQLIIKGRFQQKQIENVLRRYIKEYVTCHTCRSPDTTLQKDTRLYFLQCETCGSRCSVSSIKSGFQAVTGKRAAIRAKNA